MKNLKVLLVIVCFFSLGCAQITEVSKVIWGSSIASLERARDKAIRKTYFCEADDCFDAVLRLGRSETVEENRLPAQQVFDIFIKDKVRGRIVVMGIEGNVDTTKVAIFFDDIGQRLTRIEISSLSSTAKEKVANVVFDELSIRFSEKE